MQLYIERFPFDIKLLQLALHVWKKIVPSSCNDTFKLVPMVDRLVQRLMYQTLDRGIVFFKNGENCLIV